MASTAGARYLGGLMMLVVGSVHLQQYADFIKDVPTIGALFVLNAAGAGVIVVCLPCHACVSRSQPTGCCVVAARARLNPSMRRAFARTAG